MPSAAAALANALSQSPTGMKACNHTAAAVDGASVPWVTLIAGRLDLSKVMDHLSTERPVFHSEADFQFAFAQVVVGLDPAIRVRLEVPKRAEKRTYVDLACATDDLTTLIEFKYVTRAWWGSDGRTAEDFALREHAALDLARLYFVHDVTRLEGWAQNERDTDGLAVMLTNDNRLWEPPPAPSTTRDRAYRIHEGLTLTGRLTWGTPERPYADNDRDVRGAYRAEWNNYAHLDDRPGGRLRWLAWHIAAAAPAAP